MASDMSLQVFLRGGLGNQLFQYATALHLSEISQRDLVIRTDLLPLGQDDIGGISRWPEQISGFAHKGHICAKRNQVKNETDLRSRLLQIQRMLGDFVPNLTASLGWLAGEAKASHYPKYPRRIKLLNSYATLRLYAYKNRKELKSQISNLVRPSESFLKLLAEMQILKPVVVHVRLGDYLGLQHTYGHLQDSYFLGAVDKLRTSNPGLVIWVFSDSPEALPDELVGGLGASRIIGPFDLESPLENLVLMSKGSAIIASNSSFSWWACFLSDDSSENVAPIIESARVNNFDINDSKYAKIRLVALD